MTPSVEVGQENFFDGGEHVGELVTIVGRVVEDLPGDAIVLNAAAYGDDSLLVLLRGDTDVVPTVQGEITLTGTIGRFSHGDHAEQFDLAHESAYEPHLGENFLLAERVAAKPNATTR